MQNRADRRNADVAFEASDIRSVPVIGTGIALLVGTLATVGLIYFVFLFLRATHPDPPPRAELAPEYKNIKQPLLQSSPRLDLEGLRKRDSRLLNHYTWIDKQKGTVSVPIDRAIDKLLTEGMPAAGDYSDLKLFPPRAGERESGFDLATKGGERR